jgi:hypothetical protein
MLEAIIICAILILAYVLIINKRKEDDAWDAANQIANFIIPAKAASDHAIAISQLTLDLASSEAVRVAALVASDYNFLVYIVNYCNMNLYPRTERTPLARELADDAMISINGSLQKAQKASKDVAFYVRDLANVRFKDSQISPLYSTL